MKGYYSMFKIVTTKIRGTTTDGMKAAIEKKFNFLNSDNQEVKVTVESAGNRIKTSLSFVDKYNHHYRISESDQDFYVTLDRLKDKSKRALREYNDKRKDQKRKVVKENYEELPLVAKEKMIITTPMSLDDAITEMDNLGHNWFVFRNMDTDEINIVYIRFDNTYGVMVVR